MRQRLLSVADWSTSPGARPPRAAIVLLGGAQLLAVLFLASFALLPGPEAEPDRPFNTVMAAVSLVVAVATYVVLPRLPMWVWDGSLLLSTTVLGFVITLQTDEVGQMLNGTGLVMLALLAALFSSPRRLILHLTAIVVLYLSAVVLNDRLPTILFAVIACVMVLAVGITTHWLVQQLHVLSQYDPLTQALNRRGLEQRAEPVRSVAARSGRPTVVGLVDLDEFKAYNDAHGHLAGDRLLADVVAALTVGLRSHDLVARFGGDEFVVVLPDSTEADADAVLDRLSRSSGCTWSWGLAQWKEGESLWDALDRADQVLYEHKQDRPQ